MAPNLPVLQFILMILLLLVMFPLLLLIMFLMFLLLLLLLVVISISAYLLPCFCGGVSRSCCAVVPPLDSPYTHSKKSL